MEESCHGLIWSIILWAWFSKLQVSDYASNENIFENCGYYKIWGTPERDAEFNKNFKQTQATN